MSGSIGGTMRPRQAFTKSSPTGARCQTLPRICNEFARENRAGSRNLRRFAGGRGVARGMKRIWLLALLLPLAVSAAWAAPARAIKVGLAVGTTGDIAVYGDPIRNGFLLAFKQINALGQVRIDPILEDTGAGRDGAINVFQKLIQRDQVAAILGPVLSAQAFAADPLAVQAGVPVVGVSNTAKGIPQIGATVFRVSAPEAVQIPKSVAVAKKALNLSKVVVLYDNADDFTISGYRTFAEELQKNSVAIAD